MTALFTATSATCVTGLVAVDTALTWSVFGQAVILLMIQIGGLGVMSITVVFYIAMKKQIGLSQRLLIMKSMGLKDVQGVVRLIRHVLLGTLFFEGIGALILWFRFAPAFGLWGGLWAGVFHSVSAFCNGGFDIMGAAGGGPFSSLAAYSGDPVVMLTIIALVILGGIGFFVWEDVWRTRGIKRLHVHSKIVLSSTLLLVLSGWAILYLAERSNPLTIGMMPQRAAVFASLFQAVMPRSGGLSVVDQAALTGASRAIVIVLMLIGGSAGSTAGGIKNATFAILVISAFRSLRGKNRLSVFGRTIPPQQIITALAIMMFTLASCLAGALAIAIIQPEVLFSGVIFETASAIAICGLSQGVTPFLGPASLAVLIALMLLGRVGIMTFGMAAFLSGNRDDKLKSPDSWILMG